MYPALDVARYIINYSNEKGYGISNLKLQKLLYFVQAFYMALTPSHTPCFPEEIEAWDFGPVVPVVYHEFKRFGSNTLWPVEYSYESNENDIWSVRRIPFSNDCISKTDQEYIGDVIDNFSKYSATDLVELAHNQAPWKNAYVHGENRIISQKSIRRYFEQDEQST